MQPVVRNLRILWRSEVLLAEVRMRLLVRKIGLVAVAALIGVFALVMLDVAGFFGLMPKVGPVWAALIVAAVDFVIAGILIVVAQGLRPGPETEMVKEVRNMAVEDLEHEAEAIQKELKKLREEIEGVKDAVVSFAKHPLDSLGSNILGPLLAGLLSLLRSSKK